MTLDDSPKRTDEYPGEQNLIALGATPDPDVPHLLVAEWALLSCGRDGD